MSNPIFQIANCIETEENYNKELNDIVQGVANLKIDYITGVQKVVCDVLGMPDEEIRKKFLALQLFKECMELKQTSVISSFTESDILPLLEKHIMNFPEENSDSISISNYDTNVVYTKYFLILLKECIKYWGEAYEQEGDPINKFSDIYKRLGSNGIKFPDNYLFINPQSKNEEAPEKPVLDDQAQIDILSKDYEEKNEKTPEKPVLDDQALIDILSKDYEQLLQQPFFYNAQELDLDDELPGEQEQQEEEQQ